jgi:hypothetical protein
MKHKTHEKNQLNSGRSGRRVRGGSKLRGVSAALVGKRADLPVHQLDGHGAFDRDDNYLLDFERAIFIVAIHHANPTGS